MKVNQDLQKRRTPMINEQTEREWESWRSWCNHFNRILDTDINDSKYKEMVDAIRRWGEELVELRKDHPLPEDQLEYMRKCAPICMGPDGTP
jgi:hypothetical protein